MSQPCHEKEKMIFKNQKGVTLVEVMISGMLGSLIVLAIANSIMLGGKALKGFIIRQDLSNFRDQINSTLGSPASCIALLTGVSPTIAVGTAQATTLVTPYGTYDTTTNNKVGSDLTIQSIAYSKVLDLSAPFVQKSTTYYPVSGTITVTLSNTAVVANNAYGSKATTLTFPITMTFSKTTGAYSVFSCLAMTAGSSTNTGWPTGASCTTREAGVGQTATCPAGQYVVQYSYYPQPNFYTYTSYIPPCSCQCFSKGCGCSWSSCGYSCTPDGTASGTGTTSFAWNSCGFFGCSPSGGSCGFGIAAGAPTPKLRIYCCDVPR